MTGAKSVRTDLAWLRAQGWEHAIQCHLRYGGKLIGICGGFQMLGRRIHDPHGLEGGGGNSSGLGLLDLETTLAPEKQLRNASGRLTVGDVPVNGYEIHAGVTIGGALARHAAHLVGGPDGAISDDDLILGTYLHGLFESPDACMALLAWAGLRDTQSVDYQALRETAIERLADEVERHLDTDRLRAILELTAVPA